MEVAIAQLSSSFSRVRFDRLTLNYSKFGVFQAQQKESQRTLLKANHVLCVSVILKPELGLYNEGSDLLI